MATLTRSCFALRIAGCCIALFAAASHARAQTPATAPEAKPSATISGRVTSDEKGVGSIVVVAMPVDLAQRGKFSARAATDASGRYVLTSVPAGRYSVMPLAPAFIVADVVGGWPPGKPVSINSGESVEDVDFTVTRGGVITGRITDADGKPVISQSVRVSLVGGGMENQGRGQRPGTNTTDDRGIYRIYGLPAGRYHVSVGEDREAGIITYGVGRSRYIRTFYPNAAEEAQAKIVEVTAGGEATDIDITVGSPSKGYKVAGRIVDAETGQPVVSTSIMYGPVSKDSKSLMGGFGGQMSNARGEFQMNSVTPGRYAVFNAPDGQSEGYSDPVMFEVTDSDVSGLEIKMRRGAMMSGVVALEGSAGNRALLARLQQLTLHAYPVSRDGLNIPNTQRVQINSDGSFRLTGLRPGKLRMALGWPPQKNFTLLRVERGGAAQQDGIEVAAGEHVTGVRVVVAYGTGVIRGQVRFEDGQFPSGERMQVFARRLGNEASSQYGQGNQTVDVRGRFVIEGLAPGEYELTLHVASGNGRGRRPERVKQNVTVAEGVETPVTLVYANAGEPQEKP